ncbi:hypothetical protein P4U97_13790 [Bacillus swezeyi]|uniref:hypothetical protein n=1 Tax=Bacillus swezeyi TaxID=1925020 RepID=UPI002E1C03E2|nr:hypothetical protein [Bacillus swezeyi]
MTLTIMLFMLTLLLALNFHFDRKAFQQISLGKRSDIELIHNGEDLCGQLMNDIRQTGSLVHVMFYIMKHDAISLEFLYLLKDKAEAGIPVYLLIDRIGAMKVKRKTLRGLEESGVQVHFTNWAAFNIAKEYRVRTVERLPFTGEGVTDLQHIFLTDSKRGALLAKLKSDVFPPLPKEAVACMRSEDLRLRKHTFRLLKRRRKES